MGTRQDDNTGPRTSSPLFTSSHHGHEVEYSVHETAPNLTWNGSLAVNISDQQPRGPQRDMDLLRIEIALQAVILVLALVGNFTVLLILLGRKQKLSRMKLLIIHLAIADLFVVFFNVLPQLIWDITFRFQGGNGLCKLVKSLQLAAMYASSYVLVATAVDRYLVICHPLKTHAWSKASVHLMVCLAWASSLVLSLPQAFIFSYVETQPGSGVHDCWATFDPPWTLQLYVTWITATIYLAPFIFLSMTYGRICYIVWRSSSAKQRSVKEVHFKKTPLQGARSSKHEYTRVLTHSPPPRNGLSREGTQGSQLKQPRAHAHARTMAKSKMKTIKLTLAVVLCYLLCWGPFFISQMWAAWDVDAPYQGDAMVVITLLASLNSCTNPWIYLAFIDNICCCGDRSAQRFSRASTMDSSDGRTRSSMITRPVRHVDNRERTIAVPLVTLNSKGEAETRLG